MDGVSDVVRCEVYLRQILGEIANIGRSKRARAAKLSEDTSRINTSFVLFGETNKTANIGSLYPSNKSSLENLKLFVI